MSWATWRMPLLIGAFGACTSWLLEIVVPGDMSWLESLAGALLADAMLLIGRTVIRSEEW